MASLEFSPRALEDLDRLVDFLGRDNPSEAEATALLIVGAVEVLRRHPLIGRPAEAGLHELVVSRGQSGYLALYDFNPEADRVLIRAIRHQRESGFAE